RVYSDGTGATGDHAQRRVEESDAATIRTILPNGRAVSRQAECARRARNDVHTLWTRLGLRYKASAAGSRAGLLACRHAGEVFKRHDGLSQSRPHNLFGVWPVRAREYSPDSLSTRSQR